MGFKHFLADSEKKDVETTLAKLPKSHRDFISKYTISFQGGSTLKGDKDHIGEVDDVKKHIIVAAPWNYGREYTLLHEIAHLIWGKFVPEKQQKEWEKIAKATKMKKSDRQDPEELFAMAYSSHFAKNKIEKFVHPAWDSFVKKICS